MHLIVNVAEDNGALSEASSSCGDGVVIVVVVAVAFGWSSEGEEDEVGREFGS